MDTPYIQEPGDSIEPVQHEASTEVEPLDIATSLNYQAQSYFQQGKYADAESLLVQALAIHEQQQGHEPPDTSAAILNNLLCSMIIKRNTLTPNLYFYAH